MPWESLSRCCEVLSGLHGIFSAQDCIFSYIQDIGAVCVPLCTVSFLPVISACQYPVIVPVKIHILLLTVYDMNNDRQ